MLNKRESKKRYTSHQLFMQLGLVTVVTVFIGGLSITTAYGQAQTFTDKLTLELGAQGVPLCGGEPIVFSGNMNLIFHTTIGPNGEFEQTISHTNYQGATAISASGERYVIADNSNQISHTDQIGPNEFISVVHGTLVDKGQGVNGVNTLFQLVIRTLVDSNGEVIGTVEHIDTKCVG
jgi:hypothetical protein